ncbi:unnamed protein product [Owenia fusiformis]|uniref:Uncharacterized protein n=1 Tax=Owenia fusiformis TaxID=6347 RepID=A0A8J1U928_OWEFU|nr:unnamed protein product [Owenia fusiformis]
MYTFEADKPLPDTPPPEYDSIAEEVPKQPTPSDIVHAAGFLKKSLDGASVDYCAVAIRDTEESLNESNEVDPWALPELTDSSEKWNDLTRGQKVKRVIVGWIGKPIGLLALLYLFICSLDLLSSGFQLVGGKASGEAFTNSDVIQNPIAGLMIGIIATVMVQSSSTSTSIVVTMVASGILDVRPAIPIIMGANIGTSVTNTVVSLAHSGNKDEFRRAFGGATVHDMFNWLSVLILLPLEVLTGYLYRLTTAIIDSCNLKDTSMEKKEFLKVLTKPFTSTIIQVDKKVIQKIALGETDYAKKSLIKKWCVYKEVQKAFNLTTKQNVTIVSAEGVQRTVLSNVTEEFNMTLKVGTGKCSFMFYDTGLSDMVIGFLLLAVALFLLCTCLVLLVKLLHSILNGNIAKIIKKTINADFPGKLKFLTGYVAIIVGAGMTMLVQSSSVFTSAMTPLVGIGVISLERMYPLTLGSNIGTTMTSMLAAFASSGDKVASAFQISLVHLFFNISGILLFFPVPVMRKAPIKLAKVMGNTTARFRWFAIFYVIVMFFITPGAIFGLSMAGLLPLSIVLGTVFFVVAVVLFVNLIQDKKPKWLPTKFRNWEWLPLWMHSLEPMDNVIKAIAALFKRCCPCCCKRTQPLESRPSSRRSSISDARLVFALLETPPSSQSSSTESSRDNSPCASNMSSRSTSMLLPRTVL